MEQFLGKPEWIGKIHMKNHVKLVVWVIMLLVFQPGTLRAQGSTEKKTEKQVFSEKGITWKCARTINFVILSLDEKQTLMWKAQLENIKEKSITRWGFANEPFGVECRVVILPNKQWMQKLYRISDSRTQVLYDNQGRIQRYSIFLAQDDNPMDYLPSSLIRIYLSQYEQNHHVKLGLWFSRGLGTLSLPTSQVKKRLVFMMDAMSKQPIPFSGKDVFAMDLASLQQYNAQQRTVYDAESVVMCLLLRKEFGQKNFVKFVEGESSESALIRVYGFNGFSEFDRTFKRYLFNLANDMMQNKTPDDYLNIIPANINK